MGVAASAALHQSNKNISVYGCLNNKSFDSIELTMSIIDYRVRIRLFDSAQSRVFNTTHKSNKYMLKKKKKKERYMKL